MTDYVLIHGAWHGSWCWARVRGLLAAGAHRVFPCFSAGLEPRALQDWLRSPPDEIFEMRDMAVLQLFFSEFMSENDLVALANNQGRLYRERLATYQSIADAAGEKRIKRRRMASVHLGIRMMKACIDFWDEVAKSPPGP